MKKLLLTAVTGISLIFIGLILSYGPFMQYRDKKGLPVTSDPFSATASAETTDQQAADYLEGRPVRIVIPSISIDLQVVNGYYNTEKQTWTLSKDKAHYAVMTPLANTLGGNTFIYGHNKKEVFAKLNKLREGAVVTIYTENNHIFSYRFVGALETDPTDGSLFRYQGKPILTLQTCSGAWYQNRQLFTFKLEAAE